MSLTLYRIRFRQADAVLELYVRAIYQSQLPQILELEGLCFNHKTELVSEPAEEKVKKIFSGVARTFLPLANIERIDELNVQDFPHYLSSQSELQGVSHFAHSLLS
ncbi:MAG: DUF1820 family protein [Venatoribacter sp.]